MIRHCGCIQQGDSRSGAMTYVDDCILRGTRKHHTWFWTEAKKKFNTKHWDFVEVDQPKMICSKLIQKQIDCDGVTW